MSDISCRSDLNLLPPNHLQSEWLEEVYRDLHRHPELGMQEHRTTSKIRAAMKEFGVEQAELPGLEVGALGIVRGAQPGPVLALRADIDALPIQEDSGVEYASATSGVMHACGHDLNTTILMGVMRYVSERNLATRMKGTLKFVFQPSEETLHGAKSMIAAGVLKNPDVDMILMSHGDPELAVGEVALFKEYSHAASDHFSIALKGKGGHGSRPFQTQDLILAGARLVEALNTIVSRDIDARDAAVLSVCSFRAGSASNVIPNAGELSGTVRTLAPSVQAKIRERMQETCEYIARYFHMDVEMDYREGVPSCAVDEAAEEVLRRAAVSVVSESRIHDSKTRMGGEDFAYFSELVPAGVMRLGIAPPGGPKGASTHSPAFRADLRTIPVGVSIFVRAIEEVLTTDE